MGGEALRRVRSGCLVGGDENGPGRFVSFVPMRADNDVVVSLGKRLIPDV
jgi:hypothetical protein